MSARNSQSNPDKTNLNKRSHAPSNNSQNEQLQKSLKWQRKIPQNVLQWGESEHCVFQIMLILPLTIQSKKLASSVNGGITGQRSTLGMKRFVVNLKTGT